MLEPLDGHKDRDYGKLQRCESENEKHFQENARASRVRNDSYLGATKDGLFVRAGLQNVLQVFITQASNVFFLESSGNNATSAALLEEQTDSCKRVLNVYRYVVMHTRLEPATWEQLLRYAYFIRQIMYHYSIKLNKKKIFYFFFQSIITDNVFSIE